MEYPSDALSAVIAELARRKGNLVHLAKETGINYDTLLRIRDRKGDPGYSKVHTLHQYLFPHLHRVRASEGVTP